MTPEYSAQSIQTLDGIAHVRKRVRVYLGEDVRTTAAREVLDNASDEVARGYASKVAVTFHEDGSIEVTDNGRGVPVDFDEAAGLNGVVKALGTTMSGSNFDDTGAGSGTNGIGASATNAISDRFDVTVRRGGKQYIQQFRQGRPGHFEGVDFDPSAAFTQKDSERLSPGKSPRGAENGTTVRFIFDPTIAADAELNVEDLAYRAGLTARLIEGMELEMTREGQTTSYSGPYGAGAALEYAAQVSPLISFQGKYTFVTGDNERDVDFDVAISPSQEQKLVSAVNAVYTPEGGSHVTGVMRAIGTAMTAKKVRGLSLAKGEDYPGADDFAATAAVSISLQTPAPTFVGQDKRKLDARALGNALERELTRQLTIWAASPANNAAVTAWAQLALNHARMVRKVDAARAAARASNKNAGVGTNLSLPEKLLPSRKTGRGSGAEVFICEGDSALGTVKDSRYSDYQAAFPLRGKPINGRGRALGSPINPKPRTLRSNEEFRSLEAILGTGVQDSCDPEKCRYDRIIMATDADVDGAAIASMMISLLHDNFRPLLEEGMVYVSVPPLFIVTTDDVNERIYCVTEADRDEALERLKAEGRKRVEVQRCKGLGEMNPREFRETVMNPETRTLIQVRIDGKSEDSLEMMYGNSAEARRDWIDEMRERGITETVDISD